MVNKQELDCILRFKKTHPDAKLPTRNHASDTGCDVYAIEEVVIPARGSGVVDVGLDVAYITPGYWFQICSRSGLGFKKGIVAFPGVVDETYRGTCGVKLTNITDEDYRVLKGDKIAQFVVHRNYNVGIEEGEKTETARGESGFGSSGR